MLTTTTLIALALVASVDAGLFEEGEEFLLEDKCADVNQENNRAACLTTLVDNKKAADDQAAEDAAKRALADDQAEFDKQKRAVLPGLEGAIRALNANPTSKALINWCKGEVAKIARRERVGVDVTDCQKICDLAKKGRDSADAFACLRDKIAERAADLRDVSDDESLRQVQEAQFNQQAFFVATFEDEEETEFEDAVFGDDAESLEVQEAQFFNLVSAFTDARVLVQNNQDDADEDEFAQAFFDETVFDQEFLDNKAQVVALNALTPFDDIFTAVNERRNQPEEPVVTVTTHLIQLTEEGEDELDAEVDEIVAAVEKFLPDFDSSLVINDRKRQDIAKDNVLVVSSGSNSDLERSLNNIQIQSFCVDRNLKCSKIADTTEVEFEEAQIVDKKIVVDDGVMWKDTGKEGVKPGDKHAGYEGDDKEKVEDEEDEEDSASAIMLAASAVFASLALLM